METFWDEACRHLTLPDDELAAYRRALLERFSNPRMRDVLSRIAADGSAKLVVRTVPTIVAERAAGRIPVGAATTVAAWVLHLRGAGAPIKDVERRRGARPRPPARTSKPPFGRSSTICVPGSVATTNWSRPSSHQANNGRSLRALQRADQAERGLCAHSNEIRCDSYRDSTLGSSTSIMKSPS